MFLNLGKYTKFLLNKKPLLQGFNFLILYNYYKSSIPVLNTFCVRVDVNPGL